MGISMLRKLPLFTALILVSVLLLPSALPAESEDGITTDPRMVEQDEKIGTIGRSDHFIENLGQWSDVLSHVAGTGYGHFGITRDSLLFNVMEDEGKGDVVRYRFKDPNIPNVVPRGEVPGVFNYLVGDEDQWATGARQYEQIILEGLWKGIDLHAYSGEAGSKYEFILEPYADPGIIAIDVDGAVDLKVSNDDLIITMDSGRILEDSGLRVFYMDDPTELIDAEYSINGLTITFDLGDYDVSRHIVIDPIVRSTFIGGSSSDSLVDKVVDDKEEYVYFSGSSYSTNFPVTGGSYDTSHNSQRDVIICKMDINLSTMAFSTFVGHTGSDIGNGIDIDGLGNVYVGGYTSSSSFPVTVGSNDTDIDSYQDAFLLKLHRSGSSLVYSTFYGGDSNDEITDVMVDSSSNLNFIGFTRSADLITTSGAFDTSHNGDDDIFAGKLNSAGSSLLYSTYIGGDSYDQSTKMDMDWNGNVYLTGYSQSYDYPTTSGVYATSKTGNQDVIVTKISSGGASLLYSTYVGGSIAQVGNDVSIDASGRAYVTGYTTSLDFPVTTGCNQSNHAGGNDVFIFKLGNSGDRLLYSTFFGGSSYDYGQGIDVDSLGNVVITGSTRSPDLYTSKKAEDGSLNGWESGFLSKLDPAGANMVYSSYVGGTSYDEGWSVNFLKNGEAIMGGTSSSSAYPTTSGAYSRVHGGSDDAVLTIFNFTARPDPPLNLVGELSYGKVELSWEAPSDDGGMPILYYRIYKGEIASQLVYFKDVLDLEYTDLNITPGTGYKYTVRAMNSRGESDDSELFRAEDLEAPVLEEDHTLGNATTGDPFYFRVNASDNIHVNEVEVTYRYGFGDIYQKTLDPVGNLFEKEITVKNDLDPIKYQLKITDDFFNSILTEWKNITVTDNDLPVFLRDDTDQEGTTGDKHVFRIKVEDNMRISRVNMTYAYPGEDEKELSLQNEEGPWWRTSMVLSEDTVDPISYEFIAFDNSGNFNLSGEKSVNITDDDPVDFFEDLSQLEATTGDTFRFMINATDNIRITEVRVEYWFGKGEVTRVLMDGVRLFEADIDIPWNSTEVLHYRFKARDDQGNVNITETTDLNVTDNDLPSIIDTTGSTAGTGEKFTFTAELDDNIGIDLAKIVYRFGDSADQDRLLIEKDGVYRAELQIPRNDLDDLNYHIVAFDAQGNRQKTLEKGIPVIDVIPPSLSKMVNITMYQGKLLSTKIETSDNIGIVSMEYTGSPIEPYFLDENRSLIQIKGYVRVSGLFDVVVSVFDREGNQGSVSFALMIRPSDNDMDGDLIPDLVELDSGLNMNDPSDASLDKDGDGLSNLEEFQHGTNITKTDTDGDGMDDAWEVKYDLDAVNASGFMDTDGDGITDLEEYRKGSDPTIAEDKGFPIIVIIIIVAVVLLILIVLIVVVKGRSKKDREVVEEEPPMYVPPPEEVFKIPAAQIAQPLPVAQAAPLPQPIVDELPQPYPVQEGLPPAQDMDAVGDAQYDDHGRQVFYDDDGFPFYVDEYGVSQYYDQTIEDPSQYEQPELDHAQPPLDAPAPSGDTVEAPVDDPIEEGAEANPEPSGDPSPETQLT